MFVYIELPLFAFFRVITWTFTKNSDVIHSFWVCFLTVHVIFFHFFFLIHFLLKMSTFLNVASMIRFVTDQKLVIRNLWKDKACEKFFRDFPLFYSGKPSLFAQENHIAFSFITFWWLLSYFFIMTDYDYLVRLRFTLS